MPTTRRTRKPAPAANTTPNPDETATPATDATPAVTPDETATPATDATPTVTAPAAGPAVSVATDTTDNGTTGDPGSDTPAEAPVSGAPVSGAPVGSGDHLKIVIVAAILGDHPDGVTAAKVADESGLRAAIVGRVLAAMETAGAAVRKPAKATANGDATATTTDAGNASASTIAPDASGVELWVRGDADLTTVDLSAVAVRVVCPTCNRPMPRRNTVNVGRSPAGPGQNSDGSRTLGKNELRNQVEAFMRILGPGHNVTPILAARELGRSSGAVANAMHKLTGPGVLVITIQAPTNFAVADNAPAPSAEVAALMESMRRDTTAPATTDK